MLYIYMLYIYMLYICYIYICYICYIYVIYMLCICYIYICYIYMLYIYMLYIYKSVHIAFNALIHQIIINIFQEKLWFHFPQSTDQQIPTQRCLIWGNAETQGRAGAPAKGWLRKCEGAPNKLLPKIRI